VEIPSGMFSKKAHTCHLHLPNVLFSTVSCELTCDLDAHFARKESTAAAQREWLLLHTLTTQADADLNQQTASPKDRHAIHSAIRLGLNVILFTLSLSLSLSLFPLSLRVVNGSFA
jgi:hypothetical protein